MIEWTIAVDGMHTAMVHAGAKSFELTVQKMRRGGFLWEVVDEGGANRLPACEAGVVLTLEEGQAAAEKIARSWAA